MTTRSIGGFGFGFLKNRHCRRSTGGDVSIDRRIRIGGLRVSDGLVSGCRFLRDDPGAGEPNDRAPDSRADGQAHDECHCENSPLLLCAGGPPRHRSRDRRRRRRCPTGLAGAIDEAVFPLEPPRAFLQKPPRTKWSRESA